MSSIDKYGLLGLVVLTVWAVANLSGCAATDRRGLAAERKRVHAADAYLQDKPRQLHPRYRPVATQGRQNRVLNLMEAGLAALDTGHLDLAKRSFDEVLNGIETVFADSKQAAKARSLWRAEQSKVFKGEPYERAMAYYYRGLLYMHDGDYENARACFKGGVLQDAFAEEKQNRCDFALLIFLQGWASQCLGDTALADEAYAEVKLLRPDFKTPTPGDNVLLLAETGRSPQKVVSGPGGAELRYRRGEGFAERRVRVAIGSDHHDMYPMEDIYWQASTRGGRPVEKILKGQVVFKERHETLGTALTTIGMGTIAAGSERGNRDSDMQEIGAIVAAVGIVNIATASAVHAQADTRYWDNLPDAVHVRTLHKERNELPCVNAQFLDGSASRLKWLDADTVIHFDPNGRHGLAWLRSRSAL